MRHFLFIFFFLNAFQAFAQDAVALTPTYLFYSASDADSLPARVLQSGAGMKITGISSEQQALDHENRIFHWFHVEDAKGREGWVRGYEVATAFAASELPEFLTEFTQQKLQFPRDFGLTQVWFASINTLEQEKDDASTFSEHYLVLSNESGQNITHPLGMQTSQGKSETIEMLIQDINADQKLDFIFLKRSMPDYGALAYQLEAFTLNQGRIQTLLDQPVTINNPDNDITPCHAYCVEFEQNTIRFEGLLSPDCTKLSNQKGHCLKFETSTLQWSVPKQKFLPLYAPVQIDVKAKSTSESSLLLHTEPDANSSFLQQITYGTKLVVLSVYDQYKKSSQGKERVTWFFCQNK